MSVIERIFYVFRIVYFTCDRVTSLFVYYNIDRSILTSILTGDVIPAVYRATVVFADLVSKTKTKI